MQTTDGTGRAGAGGAAHARAAGSPRRSKFRDGRRHFSLDSHPGVTAAELSIAGFAVMDGVMMPSRFPSLAGVVFLCFGDRSSESLAGIRNDSRLVAGLIELFERYLGSRFGLVGIRTA